MTNARFPVSIAAILLLFLCSSPSVALAERITLRVQFGGKSTTVAGYDSSGVIFVSVQEYASALSLP